MKYPRTMGAPEIEAFLTMLATERKVSTSTHNQALSALLFLYREVLKMDLPWMDGINRPVAKRRIPSVLTKDEVAGLLAQMEGVTALLARLLYGTGMRLMEGIRLRVKDVDFDRHVIIVREAKGNKDRVVILPRSLVPAMRMQLLAALTQKSRCAGGHLQTGVSSHLAPFVCHTLAASGHRHSHRAGVAGPLRCEHHHDLHACTQSGSGWHGQPAGCSLQHNHLIALPWIENICPNLTDTCPS